MLTLRFLLDLVWKLRVLRYQCMLLGWLPRKSDVLLSWCGSFSLGIMFGYLTGVALAGVGQEYSPITDY